MTKPRTLKIPALDGLRAISIVMVLLAHLGGTQGFVNLEHVQKYTGSLGELGVRVFFVISGFLITSLLIDEHDRTGTISIKDFYARRAIRILPALLTYLGSMWVAEQLGWLAFSPHDWPHALTFTMNYHPHRSWYVGHLWSLSVEEQFYLLWPATIAVIGVRRSLRAAGAVVVLCPLIRIGLFVGVRSYREYVDESFETVADAIAIGCVLAGARAHLTKIAIYERVIRSRAMVLVPIVIVLSNGLERHPLISMLGGETVVNVGIALVIDWCVRNSGGAVVTTLDSASFRFLGVRSYSLYLWQQAFLNRSSGAMIAAFPWNLILALAAAIASYGLVERPLLRLRARFSR